MPHEDFDIDTLAAFLHLLPSRVTRLADRGKLPGRKVAGKWRFSRIEIHHWMEERLGLLEEEKLAHVEGVLERSAKAAGDQPISVTELLPLEAIAAPLDARTRHSVIASMVQLAAGTGLLWDPGKMEEAIRAREQMQPTALDNGVALLHPRRPMAGILAEAFLALGRTQQGIPFGGSRGTSTDIFILICSTDDRTHLRILARISRLISDGSLLTAIRQAPDALAVREAIVEREAELFP